MSESISQRYSVSKPLSADAKTYGDTGDKSGNVISVLGARQGENSLTGLYKRLWPELCAYISKTFGGGPPDPEDVVQTAFTRFSSLKGADKFEQPRALLYTIARNIVLDHKRHQQTTDRFIDNLLEEHGHRLDEITPERIVAARGQLKEQTLRINALPAKQRQILMLSRYYGYTYTEIAEKTGWSIADISRQLKTALASLRVQSAVSGEDGR